MKLVIASIQPFMAPDVVQALHRVPGLTGATFSEVKGFGRGRATLGANAEALYGTVDKLRIEVVVSDDLEDQVVRAIRTAAHTGNRGDGKIYAVAVTRALRIATGEEGDNAV
jgi:nitrogen regulatory protein P-II 1